MKVVKITPQGYCYGVVRATNIAKNSANTQPKPIYVLGDIVHNNLISKALHSFDIITIEDKTKTRLELLERINEGTVIFTAHGISPRVYEKALEKGLNIIDATCPEVNKTQENIMQKLNIGYHVIFVGQRNHPEAEACIDIDENITAIYDDYSIENIDTSHSKYYISYQSTLNKHTIEEVGKKIEDKLVNKHVINTKSICDATSIRQEAVINAKDIDFLIVVGDKQSNNTKKLVEVAKVPAVRIMSINELDLELLRNVKSVGVTSGASTPPQLVKHIIDFLNNFDINDEKTYKYEEFDYLKIFNK